MNDTLYVTQSAREPDGNRAITIKMSIHEAYLVWDAFRAFGKTPAPFDCSHPMRRALDLLSTVQTAMKNEHPDVYADSTFQWLPPINPPRPILPRGASHY